MHQPIIPLDESGFATMNMQSPLLIKASYIPNPYPRITNKEIPQSVTILPIPLHYRTRRCQNVQITNIPIVNEAISIIDNSSCETRCKATYTRAVYDFCINIIDGNRVADFGHFVDDTEHPSTEKILYSNAICMGKHVSTYHENCI